ncbi:hypothetical protein PUMCH_001921 [Australozyma saopauloensis]|uniref:PH domain-containing protein n=1 Tax=Australozyma saopauloensis TaxID=291208 RepID=A0AAX4H7R3_9ASCO|nr:hypothetical protein PUMCH_001921 [[Candida] saopauloensis]
MTTDSAVLPATDRRSPFFVNVPSHEAKPINHLIQYFKFWKHFISALIAYLKDLVLAKEFDSNLNLQLISSVQFPGFRDLPYRCISELESTNNYAATTLSSPKNEVNKTLGSLLTPVVSNEPKRPNLPRAKSASSFLKNQPFAHRRSTSSTTNDQDGASEYSYGKALPGTKALQQSGKGVQQGKNRPNTISPQNSSTNVAQNILAAMLASKADIAIDPTYFPPDSLFMNMGSALVSNHLNIHQAQLRLCREIQHKFIPNLEQLHRNLSIKIKEIKSLLKNDSFANPNLVKEVSKTGVWINDYVNAVRRYSGSKPFIKKHVENEDERDSVCLNDPFLIKLSLDHQLKSQLILENFIFALYVNLQNISKDLLNYVIKDLNGVSDKMIKSMSSEAVYATNMEETLVNLGVTLRNKLKTLTYNWEYFMSHNKNFLNVFYDTPESPKREIRSFKDVVYPYSKSVHSKCLRCGFIYRKQKVMKSYVSYFYVLTCNYLHEFKIDTNNEKKQKDKGVSPHHNKKKTKGKVGGVISHDDRPTKSYNLNDFTIDVKDSGELKFIMQQVSGKEKISFKCLNVNDFTAWTTDLQDLLKFCSNHLKRFKFIEEKLAMRANVADDSSRETTPIPSVPGRGQQEMSLNLKNLLSDKNSLERILPSSLNGAFTPKVQSPNEQATNPFDNFEMKLDNNGSSSPSLEPVVSPEPTEQKQSELEDYLRLQNELMAQQQKLMLIEEDRQLSISRTSSEESMTSGLNTNNNLPLFLGQNEVYMNQIGRHHQTTESLSSLPEVLILDHGSNNHY